MIAFKQTNIKLTVMKLMAFIKPYEHIAYVPFKCWWVLLMYWVWWLLDRMQVYQLNGKIRPNKKANKDMRTIKLTVRQLSSTFSTYFSEIKFYKRMSYFLLSSSISDTFSPNSRGFLRSCYWSWCYSSMFMRTLNTILY